MTKIRWLSQDDRYRKSIWQNTKSQTHRNREQTSGNQGLRSEVDGQRWFKGCRLPIIRFISSVYHIDYSWQCCVIYLEIAKWVNPNVLITKIILQYVSLPNQLIEHTNHVICQWYLHKLYLNKCEINKSVLVCFTRHWNGTHTETMYEYNKYMTTWDMILVKIQHTYLD